MTDWDMNGDTTEAGYRAQLDQAAGVIADRNGENANALRVMRLAYATLAFAFRRLHESARTRDGELCRDLEKVRAEIEAHFRHHGVSL
jgi:hypothetical protein